MTGSGAEYESGLPHGDQTTGELLLEASDQLAEAVSNGEMRDDQRRAIREMYSDLKPVAEAIRTDEKRGEA